MIRTSDEGNARGSDPVLEVDGVSKYFERVRAVREVSLSIRPGECLGLVGDNGAGKTTLIRILSGQLAPDIGEVRVRGIPMADWSVITARREGITTVAQDLDLCDELDVPSNVFLNSEMHKWRVGPIGWVDRESMVDETNRLLQEIGASVPNTSTRVERLSGGQRQAIAIARALRGRPQLVLMDEPTAALGVRQATTTLAGIRRMIDKGIGVVFISHNLDQVLGVCDRLVAMFQGKVTLDEPVASLPRERIHAAMMGRGE